MDVAGGERFRTKVDWVFILVFLFLGVRVGAPAGYAIADGRIPAPMQVLFPVAVLGALAWLAASTYYVVTDDVLLVRGGPFTLKVPTASIYKLRATRTLLAAPALSLDRIEVLARNSSGAVISPTDRRGFVAALRRRVPNLEVEGVDVDS